jgi:hypothetical protein
MTDEELRKELQKYNINVPITRTTRDCLIKRLKNLKKQERIKRNDQEREVEVHVDYIDVVMKDVSKLKPKK